jgi:large subunit ribosomal protein L6
VRPVNPQVTVKNESGTLKFAPANESVEADALSGTTRALVANMVNGVSKGFEQKLNLVGVGFRAAAAGSKLNLQIGFSHPVVKEMPAGESVAADAMSGTMRALVANMVNGVSKGFEKKLNLVGVGFRAAAAGSKLNLQIGFSHPVAKDMPAGVTVACPTQTEIVIKGSDRQVVGQIAAEVRAIRPPEPYKGKGIRYADEKVVIKETKKK